jgi:hypothetical protein
MAVERKLFGIARRPSLAGVSICDGCPTYTEARDVGPIATNDAIKAHFTLRILMKIQGHPSKSFWLIRLHVTGSRGAQRGDPDSKTTDYTKCTAHNTPKSSNTVSEIPAWFLFSGKQYERPRAPSLSHAHCQQPWSLQNVASRQCWLVFLDLKYCQRSRHKTTSLVTRRSHVHAPYVAFPLQKPSRCDSKQQALPAGRMTSTIYLD